MWNNIKKYLSKFHDINFRILWFEQLLLSVIIGSSFNSLLLFCLVFLGLSWVLSRSRGLLYMVYILSFIWGLIGMVAGYCLSGLWWGISLGLLFFILGLVIHFRDLKQIVVDNKDTEEGEIDNDYNWFIRKQSLN